MKYINGLTVVEAITFEEFIEYGKNNCTSLVDEVPWSFEYNDHMVTHENDGLYILSNSEHDIYFGINDMLITNADGELSSLDIEEFNEMYEELGTPSASTKHYLNSVNEKQYEKMILIRELATQLDEFIQNECPKSREASIAITKLEECSMWAIKSITHN